MGAGRLDLRPYLSSAPPPSINRPHLTPTPMQAQAGGMEARQEVVAAAVAGLGMADPIRCVFESAGCVLLYRLSDSAARLPSPIAIRLPTNPFTQTASAAPSP